MSLLWLRLWLLFVCAAPCMLPRNNTLPPCSFSCVLACLHRQTVSHMTPLWRQCHCLGLDVSHTLCAIWSQTQSLGIAGQQVLLWNMLGNCVMIVVQD